MSTGRPHHYDHLLQVYKESLQPLTLYTSFHDLINVYSRRSVADNPRGQNFEVNRNLLSLQSLAQKNLFEVWFYTIFFMILYIYIHVALGQGLTTPRWRNFYVRGRQPPGDKVLMSTEMSCHFIHLMQVLKKCLWSLILYNLFYYLIHVYSPGAGADSPLDVNRKALSLYPFVASFKEISLKSDLIHFFSWFNTCI